MFRLIILFCLLLIQCDLKAQKPYLDIGLGVGSFASSGSDQGKALLSFSPRILLNDKIGLGLDFQTGGNLFPFDALFEVEEERNETEIFRLINSSSVRFQSLALSAEYYFLQKKLLYLYAGLDLGVTDLNFPNLYIDGFPQPSTSDQFYYAPELGIAYKEVRVSFSYQNHGRLNGYDLIRGNETIRLDPHLVSFLFFKISYNWDFSL